jgi:GlpG protein
MRRIGIFEIQKDALRFWNYLKEKGVDSSLEEESKSEWSIWVAEEDQVQSAQNDLKTFRENPLDQTFDVANPRPVPSFDDPVEKPPKRSGFKQFDLRRQWSRQERKPGLFTLSLIITSVAVFLVSGMGQNPMISNPLKITSAILDGQIWRLITPIFLHLSIFHIFFNMWWLYDLGSQIESKKGSKFFLTFVVLLAVASNLSQYFYSGPNFGGMSGVIYGLFGYVWIKSRFDPADGFQLDPTIAIIMFGFFFLCFFGIFGNIANLAHAGGLVVGLAWGYASAFKWNRG